MKIKVWGARGSTPVPHHPEEIHRRVRQLLHEFLRSGATTASAIDEFLSLQPRHRLRGYGGNTPCIEVMAGETGLIVDAGSGLRLLGNERMAGPCGRGEGECHLLFTHFHWDHLIGLPFFKPMFVRGNTIHVYAVQDTLREAFATVFQRPYFPVPLDELACRIVYHRLPPRQVSRIGDIEVAPYLLDHPDPCWGFRFEYAGRVYAHCVDTEAKRIERLELGEDLPLYQNVDLMGFDAQYSLYEMDYKIDWGHGTAARGLEIALREGIPRVLFMHHDPSATDAKIAAAEEEARRYYRDMLSSWSELPMHRSVEFCFAHEGMVVPV